MSGTGTSGNAAVETNVPNRGAERLANTGARDSRVVILVDASNVAHGKTSGSSQPQLSYLERTLKHLSSYPVEVVALADASLRHKIDRGPELEEMFSSDKLNQVPAGTGADDFLWQMWKGYRKRGIRAFILTNDRFPITYAKAETIRENPRIAYLFMNEELVFQPPIEAILASGSLPLLGASPPSAQDARAAEPPESAHDSEGSHVRLAATADATRAGELLPRSADRVGTPPLASTLEREEAEEGENGADNELILAAIEVIAAHTEHPGGTVRRINFAIVAHDLHQRADGNFVRKFHLHRPKDLADRLVRLNLVTVSYSNKTMYVEPTSQLEAQIERAGYSRRTAPATSDLSTSGQQTPLRVGLSPSDVVPAGDSEIPVIDVSAGAPAPIVEVESPDVFLRLARDHRPQHIFHWPCSKYKNQFGSDFRVGGEFFFVAIGTAYRLPGKAYRTLDDFVNGRSHGFKGADHPSLIGSEEVRPRYEGEYVPMIWEEVRDFSDLGYQSGVRPLEGDVYYCARASGFSELKDFLADRTKKQKERPHYV